MYEPKPTYEELLNRIKRADRELAKLKCEERKLERLRQKEMKPAPAPKIYVHRKATAWFVSGGLPTLGKNR